MLHPLPALLISSFHGFTYGYYCIDDSKGRSGQPIGMNECDPTPHPFDDRPNNGAAREPLSGNEPPFFLERNRYYLEQMNDDTYVIHQFFHKNQFPIETVSKAKANNPEPAAFLRPQCWCTTQEIFGQPSFEKYSTVNNIYSTVGCPRGKISRAEELP